MGDGYGIPFAVSSLLKRTSTLRSGPKSFFLLMWTSIKNLSALPLTEPLPFCRGRGEAAGRMQGMNASDQGSKALGVETRLIELIVMMSEEQKRSLVEELEERLHIKKRRQGRKPYFSTVCYTAQDGPHVDFIQNISAGGLFIGTNHAPSVGEELTLAFPLPISQEHIMLDGEIVWATKQGMGVKFKRISNDDEGKIERLVDMI